ncbi:MAG: glycosyltransferase [Kiritimatiellia bacterium]
MRDILAGEFDLVDCYYEKAYECELPERGSRHFDVALFFEFLPDRRRICIPGVPCVFVPMFDNEWGSKWQWRRIAASGMSVISFCGKVSEHARACGVERLLDVRFFPGAEGDGDMRGDPRRVLLWERGDIGFATIKALFAPDAVESVTLLRRGEGKRMGDASISGQDMRDYKVNIVETGYLPRAEFIEIMRPAGTVVAPRLKEGIGMAFLEAMAMGKIVVANDDATMNETIRDGENGFLFDWRNPKRLDMSQIVALHERGFSCESLRARWLEDRKKISEFVRSSPPCAVPCNDLYRYVRFLAEGAIMRVREKFDLRR